MSRENKFHASPAMIRKLYDRFGPSSNIFHFDYDNFQYQFMKFTVIERIVDALIQKIRSVYNFTIISEEKEFLIEFEKIHELINYYSSSDNEKVKKVVAFLTTLGETRDTYYSDTKNIEFLIFIQNTFTNSIQTLKKALNDRIEIGLYYHEKFTFFDKLFKSLQQQIKKAEDLSNEFEQIISINKAPDQEDEEFNDLGIKDEDDQVPLIEKFVTAFKSSLT